MIIEINGWSQYNPRKELKSMSWFKLQSDIATSRKLFQLTPEQKWLWIFILSECAKNNTSSYKIDLEYISFYSGVTISVIEESIKIFSNRDLIVICNAEQCIRNEPVTNPIRTRNELDTNSYGQKKYEHDHEQKRVIERKKERKEKKEKKERGEEKEKENAPPHKNFTSIIINLWDTVLGEKLNRYALKNQSRSTIENLKNSTGWLTTAEDWEQLFLKASKSKFLMDSKNSWFTFSWIVDYDNASKVLEGKYSDPVESDTLDRSKLSKETLRILEEAEAKHSQ